MAGACCSLKISWAENGFNNFYLFHNLNYWYNNRIIIWCILNVKTFHCILYQPCSCYTLYLLTLQSCNDVWFEKSTGRSLRIYFFQEKNVFFVINCVYPSVSTCSSIKYKCKCAYILLKSNDAPCASFSMYLL